MSELGNRIIEDVKLAGLVEGTSRTYVQAVRQQTAHYWLAPAWLSNRGQKARAWIPAGLLIKDSQVSNGQDGHLKLRPGRGVEVQADIRYKGPGRGCGTIRRRSSRD